MKLLNPGVVGYLAWRMVWKWNGFYLTTHDPHGAVCKKKQHTPDTHCVCLVPGSALELLLRKHQSVYGCKHC